MNAFRLFISQLVIAAAGLAPAHFASAQAQGSEHSAPAPVPIDSFFRLPQFGSAVLSPDRTHLAFLREVKGRMNLLVMNLVTRQLTNLAGFDNADVVQYRWLNADRLMYYVLDLRAGIGQSDKQGIFAINRDGTAPLTLSEGLGSYGGTVGSNRGLPGRADFYRRVRSGNKDDFIAEELVLNPFRSTLTRINSRTGLRSAVDSGGIANVVAWALDANDVPRAARTQDGERSAFHVRESATSPWRKVADFNVFEASTYEPLSFDKAGNLYVAGRIEGRDLAAIHRFDWSKTAPEPQPLASIKGHDIASGLLFDDEGDRLLGVRFKAETDGTFWLDKSMQQRQDTVDQALPGRVNELSGRPDGWMVVRSFSDTRPDRYYLFDTLSNKLSLLGASRPWVDEALQSKSDFIRYPARDGLGIPALLTLPRTSDGKGLPLIVLVHGGPFVRGVDWAWNRERQFLASRGYAVLEPEFRGSQGFGWKHFHAGWKQLGLAMQDDLADGVNDLVKRGIIDANRVCIAGASYGGYATAFGLIKHPEIYKCGVSWVGMTDIEMLYTVGWSDTGNSAESRLGLKRLFGDPVADKEQLRTTSAVHQAARLKAPLILAYGKEDVRVPYEHGQRLRDATRGLNSNVQYIEYGGEGHGWRLLSTNVDFWGRVEKLLADHVGAPR